MKRTAYFIAAFICLFCNIAVAQTAKQKVAVYVTGDAESGYKKVIGSKLVTGITRSEGYAAVERTADFLAELNKEHDYQMSGVVSDNQIARLGQQFGVRYVLVADVSEVFESMFISARMIDVQTAQITASTEASEAVSNMENLTKIADKITLEIMGIPVISEDVVKHISVSTFDNLYQLRSPSGYHLATFEELEKIIKNYQNTGKKLFFPIFTDIKSHTDYSTQYFTVQKYRTNNSSKVLETLSKNRSYEKLTITCALITNISNSPTLYDFSYVNDEDYARLYNYWNTPADFNHYRYVSRGLRDMSIPKPNIPAGYVYFIKNKQ